MGIAVIPRQPKKPTQAREVRLVFDEEPLAIGGADADRGDTFGVVVRGAAVEVGDLGVGGGVERSARA